MTNRIKLFKVLDYYDGPILFQGKDSLGKDSICMRIEASIDKIEYLSKPVSKRTLFQFLTVQIDLRSLFTSNEESLYLLEYDKNQDDFGITPISWEQVTDDILPKHGLFYEPEEVDVSPFEGFHFIQNDFSQYSIIKPSDSEHNNLIFSRHWIKDIKKKNDVEYTRDSVLV